jgi:hypothetical protein
MESAAGFLLSWLNLPLRMRAAAFLVGVPGEVSGAVDGVRLVAGNAEILCLFPMGRLANRRMSVF